MRHPHYDKLAKNHKVLVGPPVRHERDNYKYFSTGDFRVWHVLCDSFVLRDDTMEETDEFIIGWEFEDDPVMPEAEDEEYDEDDEDDEEEDDEIFFSENI